MMLVKISSLYLMGNLINLMLLYHKDSDADVGNNSDKSNLHYFFSVFMDDGCDVWCHVMHFELSN